MYYTDINEEARDCLELNKNTEIRIGRAGELWI